MTNDKKSLLDELEEDQQEKQTKQQQTNEQIGKQEKTLNPLIEKMEAYATKVREKGVEIAFNEIRNGGIRWHPDTGTIITPSKGCKETIDKGYTFLIREEKHGEETNKKTVELVNECFSTIFRTEIKGRIYNPLSQRIIIFRPTTDEINMYWAWTYSADVTYHGDNLLSRTKAISLYHGSSKLTVEGFSDSDIENCFKFLLGKSNHVFLSKEAKSDSSGCFIATAACGTPLAEEVVWLSRFRDDVLAKRVVGLKFINTYYKISPPIASWISRYDLAKTVVRNLMIRPLSKLARLFTD